MKRAAFLSIALCFCAALPAQAEVKYTASLLRDPFALQMDAPKPGIDEPDGLVKKVLLWTVQGVVASQTNPRAIINGKIYRIGAEPIPGVKVTRIDKDGVYVSVGQKEVLLNRRAQTMSKGKTNNDFTKKAY